MLTGLSLPALLEELAAPREVPGAGSALAVALAAAAAVVQMAARLSPASWADAAGVARGPVVGDLPHARHPLDAVAV